MELKVFEILTDEDHLRQLHRLLVLADKEFIPPLSSRGSTTQQTLAGGSSQGIEDYFQEMKQQCFVLALDGQQIAGFMSFRKDYSCDHVPACANLYASTCVVAPEYRGQGLMKKFYQAMIGHYPDRPIYTRTWHENIPHLRILDKLGFRQIAKLENHRGQGVHTVYYERQPKKPIRVAICQFGEETNTFVPGCLELADLSPNGFVPADRVISHFGDTKTYIGGALDAIKEFGAVPVPMDTPAANGANFVAGAVLSGACIEEAAQRICGELKARRDEYDCIFFGMHGAAVSVIDEDVESYMLRAIRQDVGDVKIMSSLDLHGNITQEMVELSDGYIGLKTVPHVDCYDAGYQAALLLLKTVDGQVDPKMALCRLPLLVSSAAGCTMEGAAKAIKDHFEQYVKEHGLLDAFFFHGFSSTDRACSCASVLVLADGYKPEKEAHALAQFVWSQRQGLVPSTLTAKEAVDQALTLVKDGYVVINECSDNPGSGCPGDSTHLLRELLRRDLPRSIMGQLVDPEAAAICHTHKIGDQFRLKLGGKELPEMDSPIEADVELLALSDGTFVSVSPVNAGVTMRFGPTARVRIGQVEVTVVSERFQTFDDRPFLMTGCDMKDYSIVCLKSMNHFRAYFAPIADAIVTADTPGLRPASIKNATFKHVVRPIYPLDEQVQF